MLLIISESQDAAPVTRQAFTTMLEFKRQQNARQLLQSRLDQANDQVSKLMEESLVRCWLLSKRAMASQLSTVPKHYSIWVLCGDVCMCLTCCRL